MQLFLSILVFISMLTAVDYSSEIQPIFDSSCTGCHNPDSGGWSNHQLDLTSYSGLISGSENGDMVVPGEASSSVLYDRIIRENSEQGDMPPGNSQLDESEIALIESWINEGALEFEATCEQGFVEILDVPNSCIVFDQSDCFYEEDIQILSDIAELNGMLDIDPLYLGSQNWLNGRLKRIQVGNTFQGGNVTLTALPESISNLDSLNTLQVDKNALTSLPTEIGNLSRLQLLIASNNDLISIPESVNNLSQVWYLDLGYNALESIPDISDMNSLQYLYIFGNQISSNSKLEPTITEDCFKFYHDKTKQRVAQFIKNKDKSYLDKHTINTKKCNSISYYLEKINWEELCSSPIVSKIFHGDMQFDNIIKTMNGYKFIDWRDKFGDSIDYADSYYDLAKLYGGICMNYSYMKDETNYSIFKHFNGIEYSFKLDKDVEICTYKFIQMCKIYDFDFSKIQILTALIYLNMAPLHDNGFDDVLFFHAIKQLSDIYDA